jgi:hypothetical protein
MMQHNSMMLLHFPGNKRQFFGRCDSKETTNNGGLMYLCLQL